MNLIKLEDGKWVNPREVKSIQAEDKLGDIFPKPLVRVTIQGQCLCIRCETYPDAKKLADEIGQQIQQAISAEEFVEAQRLHNSKPQKEIEKQ